MLGFNVIPIRASLIAGIETMHMIKKGQIDCLADQASSAASKLYTLAF
jgi:putative transposase